MPRVIVFDVNETLLNIAALDPLFDELFGDTHARVEWFLTLEECWMTATILNQFQPFGDLAQAALVMVGKGRGLDVGQGARQKLIDAMRALPAHSDVSPTLELLKSSDLQLVALSNGSLKALQQRLEFAGLTDKFEAIVSVDEVQRYKPAPEPYQLVAERLGVTTSEMMMVAAHAWDIAGAASAGCRTAFVERPGKALNPAGVQPDIQGKDLPEVAEKILAL